MIYKDPAEMSIWCDIKSYQKPLLGCLKCPKYPCRGITSEHQDILKNSLFVELRKDILVERSLPMCVYIFKMNDGSLMSAPENFDPDAPDFALLEDVEEVLVIGKVLVKQCRLVAKDRETRAAIRRANSTPEDGERRRPGRPRRDAGTVAEAEPEEMEAGAEDADVPDMQPAEQNDARGDAAPAGAVE